MQEKKSTETNILLRNVDLETTGQFRCEISGEAPLFQTAYKEGIMAVVGKTPFFEFCTRGNLSVTLVRWCSIGHFKSSIAMFKNPTLVTKISFLADFETEN